MSVFFFFSSRRRHTRYIGDWSSDVCSSDLLMSDGTWNYSYDAEGNLSGKSPVAGSSNTKSWTYLYDHRNQMRSEERRVGKSVDYGGGRVIKKKRIYNEEIESNDVSNI